MNEFSLGWPLWLLALLLLPLAAGLYVWAGNQRRALLERLVASRLAGRLTGSISPRRRRLKFGLMLAGLGCAIFALAAPRYGHTFEEAKRRGRDLVIAIDTSRSMLANDVNPDRLSRAKLAAQDLIAALEGDRVGLVAFAGKAFLQAPMTVDENAVLTSLRELDTNVIPLGGTNLAAAIATSLDAFGKGESDSRALVVFTDGEELHDDALAAARRAAGKVRIFTVGVGSNDGALIPVPAEGGGTEFVRDEKGEFVKSRLDEGRLKAIAEATGGFYTHLQNGPVDMQRIIDAGLSGLSETEHDERMARRPIERYQWPLGLGITLIFVSAVMGERRRNGNGWLKKAAAGMMIFSVTLPGAMAEENAAREGLAKVEELLRLQPNSPALHFNKGTWHHALGEYDEAIRSFSDALAGASDRELRAKVEYNLGTTLLQRALQRPEGKERKADLESAIEHLDETLKVQPENGKAKTNKEIAQKELEPKPTPEPSPTPPPQDDQQKDDQQKDDQQKDDQQKDDQQKEGQGSPTPSPTPSPENHSGNDGQPPLPEKGEEEPPGEPSARPSPTPDQGKPEGDITAPNEPAPTPAAGQEAPAQEPPPGEMSEEQAKAVLDSLKGADDQPFKRLKRGEAPPLKDW